MNSYSEITSVVNYGLSNIVARDGVRLGALAKYLSSACQGPIAIADGSCINRCLVGKYFGIGLYSYIADTKIGRYCSLGSRLSIGAFNHPTNWLSVHEFSYRDTSSIWGESLLGGGENQLKDLLIATNIGNDVWIGDNAVVLRGINIGSGAIVGAQSVVVQDIPPYAVVVGNPARVVHYRFEPEVIEELLNLKWWELDMVALKGLDFSDVHSAIKELRKRKSMVAYSNLSNMN